MTIGICYIDTLPRLQKALEEAEMIFQQLSVKEYQVYCCQGNYAVTIDYQQSCIIQKKQGHDSSVANDSTITSSDLVMYVSIATRCIILFYCNLEMLNSIP